MGTRVGYGRVSTVDQNADSQRDKLEEAGCSRVFVDQGASGKNRGRPELEAALNYVRPGDTLVITRLSRLARSLKDLIALVEELREQGVELEVTEQKIETSSPEGRLFFHLVGSFDQFTRELIVTGTNEGLAAARKRGRVGGRPVVISEDMIAAAQARRARGESVAQIRDAVLRANGEHASRAAWYAALAG
jgi:DNA invertase Pin-like site-specific DNA recombinase